MGCHACHGQAGARNGVVIEIIALVPLRIGIDRLAPHLVEGDVLRRMLGRSSHRDGREDAVGITRRPLQHLHAAHRAADHAEQLVDAQVVQQHGLGIHHVADGDDGEAQAIGFAGGRIGFGRARRAHAAAQHIGADHEESIGVDDLARAHGGQPPARLAGHRMGIRHMLVHGERVADQDGVRLLGIQMPIGRIGDLVGAEVEPAIELQGQGFAQGDPVAGTDGIVAGQRGECGTHGRQPGYPTGLGAGISAGPVGRGEAWPGPCPARVPVLSDPRRWCQCFLCFSGAKPLRLCGFFSPRYPVSHE